MSPEWCLIMNDNVIDAFKEISRRCLPWLDENKISIVVKKRLDLLYVYCIEISYGGTVLASTTFDNTDTDKQNIYKHIETQLAKLNAEAERLAEPPDWRPNETIPEDYHQ